MIQIQNTIRTKLLGVGCWGWAFMLPLLSFGQTLDQNWVKQTVYKVATATPIASPTAAEASVSVTYMDGLGRPVMQIANKQSNTGKDIVMPIEYDGFGRRVKNYMPYVAANADMTFTDYNTQDINVLIAPSYPQYGEQNFYSETLYEASPLNRILKQAAPGDTNTWAMGSGHEIKYAYQANTVDDAVIHYTVSASGQLVNSGFYDANTLYTTILYNENSATEPSDDNDHATITYTNLRGQVVLKRTYNDSMQNGVLTIKLAHDTYNVYDYLDNLSFVIPPLVTDITTQLETLCYQYKYDTYNRLIEKKTPGKDVWENIVYDKLNRIVATGPVASPFGDEAMGYMLSRYDNLNRVCYTGWYATALPRSDIQLAFNGAVSNTVKTDTGTIDSKTLWYTAVGLPSNFKLLTVNYYDNYRFPDAPTDFTPTPEYPVYYGNMIVPKGLPTGSWVRVLTATGTVGETSSILYDYRARPIKTIKTNYKGGYTNTYTQLDFTGKTLVATTRHQNQIAPSGNTPPVALQTKDVFSYSNQDRLTLHTKQINNEAVQVLTEPVYNELGQLLYKNVGGKLGAPRLQKVDYTYNIRGWLTSINQVRNLSNSQPLNIASEPNDLFGFKLNYIDFMSDTKMYNGNISNIHWRSANDNILRKYNFMYDQGNRLTSAVYSKPEASTPDTDAYNESATYDANGNIMTLNRNGGQDGASHNEIDLLSYTYQPNSNRLAMVYDASNSPQGFKDNDSATAFDEADYSYDTNGNLKEDKNKQITAIKYNHLNLPTEIIFTATKKIVYLYDASGSKLQKVVTSGTSVVTTDYLDGYQYRNGILQFFGTSEGYVVDTRTKTDPTTQKDNFNYVYNYLDHLGNVRMSYSLDEATQVLKIIEENGYYPYGMKHEAYNTVLNRYKAVLNDTKVALKEQPSGGGVTAMDDSFNKYRFNGQEYQSELGLNITAMDYRQYDNAIGRFNCLDKLSEMNYEQSPYHFANNNPVLFSDPTGLDGYTDMWNSSQAQLNSSLGGSWGNTGPLGSFAHNNFISEESNGTQLDIDMSLIADGHTFFNFSGGEIVGGGFSAGGSIKAGYEWDSNGDNKLSKNEADSWFLYGNGVGISVDNNYIDWSGLKMPNSTAVGSNFSIKTTVAFKNLPWETASTYGGTSFRRTGENTANVLDQKYHYDLRSNSSAENIARNIMNELGRPSTNYPRALTPPNMGNWFMIHYINPTIYFK
jgi:RHS repeat-associated protein